MANLLAPGINTGFVMAPPAVFERLASLRAASDARGDTAMECAIAELFEDGELLRHMRRIRRIYATRRDAMTASLVRHLGSAVTFRVPDGGMGIWVRVDDAIDIAAWSLAGEREGVQFFSAERYALFHHEQPFLRLGFSYHDEIELDEAVRRMARALPHTRRRVAGVTHQATARAAN
jgi:GntR family transcriptional regulator/MocR family aminotransferase